MLRPVLPLVALALAGCADSRAFREPAEPEGEAAYRVGCADVLHVAFDDRPEWDCLVSVGLDGRLPLGAVGAPLADGGTPDDVRVAVARITALDPNRVRVRVVEARAGRVYVHGPENNRQRVVPYRGPEPVVSFLARVGALTPGCSDLKDVYVLRPNVAVGAEPQVFKVDVEAVVLDADHRTNVTVRPSDQVYVGETRRSSFGRLLPDWFRPAYRQLVGLLPEGRPWDR